ncbi:PKD domain-containing protein [Pedobacter sp. MC2016-15]|uniref:PKD domain-containing protein n=1 Tax=Pedobacter sp. MC2016-15 TaxID=2994473 RepID=UPI002246F6C4|nr:PKD domain-containing protein [Pedobacter sp. MC2016-15]MCX2478062.1 PKD domain-containing protein [Pedobacter sp. MC2016-15]
MSDTTIKQGKSVSSNSQGYFLLYIFIAILLLTAIIFIFKTSFFAQPAIDARILKDELYLNEKIVFADNTRNGKTWLWEFGNGEHAATQNGSYQYHKSGSYIVRLTVNGSLRQQFPVTVRDTLTAVPDTSITISGPTSGVVNEEVRLEAEGRANQFEWYFGETSRLDVKGKTALYTFHKPGKYLVKLRTDRNLKASYHTLFITDPVAVLDTDIVIPGEGERKIIDDIRARLQAIANGADFNSNYYYLTRTYLCNNEKVSVAIEQDSLRKTSDFYSYCMGLTFGGEISVDKAQLNISPNSPCATLLNIKQHSARVLKK